MSSALLAYLGGMVTLADFVIALFFLRFWSRTRDRLFAFFSLAFVLLGVQRIVLGVMREWGERSVPLYSLRLLAFVIIFAAIVDKNRANR
jgi:hypothetical protein